MSNRKYDDFAPPFVNWQNYRNKDEWGPPGWNWIHIFTIRYPIHPTEEDKKYAMSTLRQFVDTLPCVECKKHAAIYINSNPPNLQNTYSFREWARNFHNMVNLRLRKRCISYEEFRELYSEEIGWAECGVNCRK